MKIEAKKDLRRLITVVLASLLMAINIKTFVRAGGLYPGGATGLTILIQRISQMYLPHEIPYSPINILLNAIPVYIGFRFIGKKFTFFSLIMILLTGFFTDLMPAHVITYDTLISHVWGPYADDNNRILRVNMANIRRKLEQNPAQPEYIFTEIGIGYRMIDAD